MLGSFFAIFPAFLPRGNAGAVLPGFPEALHKGGFCNRPFGMRFARLSAPDGGSSPPPATAAHLPASHRCGTAPGTLPHTADDKFPQ